MKTRFFLLVILVLFLSNCLFAQQEPLITIQRDIATDFGTYHPIPVQVTPNADSYTVNPDFSNVVNFSDFHFTEEEKGFLRQNYFVVTPPESTSLPAPYREIYDVYNANLIGAIPTFVTSDAMLHMFHLFYDNLLMSAERRFFISDLNELLGQLIQELSQQYQTATDSLVRSALWTDTNFLIVAKSLLDTTFVPSQATSVPLDSARKELGLIYNKKRFNRSPIFSYLEDYSQYKPRGHYTRNDSLKHYFRSMMWLGRMTFSGDSFCTGKHTRRETLAAILLTRALFRLEQTGYPAIQIWKRIYEPTVFFVGKSDDLTIFVYDRLAKSIYKDDYVSQPLPVFADTAKLNSFLGAVQLLSHARIFYPEQPSIGMRFMGQRFIPDSYIFANLVWPEGDSTCTLPRGLDVCAVLGSKRAYQIEDQIYHRTSCPLYNSNLDSLQQEFTAYTDSVWAQNLYWNWLYVLMPLLTVKGTGYPPFMQTPAWVDKDLATALASWSELRHDTILYAKQSGTPIGQGPEPYLPQGYVEPNPEVFARLAALTEFMKNGLERFNLLTNQTRDALLAFYQLQLNLKIVAEKELSREHLTFNENKMIQLIGETLRGLLEFGFPEMYPGKRPEGMAVVADVHTDPNTGNVLEEGVGYPRIIYVICNIEGHLVVTRGAAYSYYEFTRPISSRMTDEEWRALLETPNQPDLPVWQGSFANNRKYCFNHLLPVNDIYTGGYVTAYATMVKDTVSQSDSIRLHLEIHGWYAGTLVTRFFQNNQCVAGSDSIYLGVCKDTTLSVSANLFKPGWVLASTIYFPEGGAYDMPDSMVVYSRVFVQESNSVSKKLRTQPAILTLWNNHPNPFQNETLVGFSIPGKQNVVLSIYNVLGEKVFEKSFARTGASFIQFRWNGRNSIGAKLPAGTYFYQIQYGDKIIRKKMLLLK